MASDAIPMGKVHDETLQKSKGEMPERDTALASAQSVALPLRRAIFNGAIKRIIR